MSSNNPIIALLANEKLSGDNFVKWKSNINIVLICENQKFVVTEECPSEPPANASHTVREDMIVGFIPTTKPAVTCLLA